MSVMAIRVAFRWLEANQPPGQRSRVRDLTQPINKPKGISKDLVKDQAVSVTEGEDVVKPHRRDILPKDVFPATPANMGVLDFAQTGEDLSKAIEKQIPKDKGYDTVKNLSQYLIYTEGGGGGDPEGRK